MMPKKKLVKSKKLIGSGSKSSSSKTKTMTPGEAARLKRERKEMAVHRLKGTVHYKEPNPTEAQKRARSDYKDFGIGYSKDSEILRELEKQRTESLMEITRGWDNPLYREARDVLRLRIHNEAVDKTVAQERKGNPQYARKTIDGIEMESFAIFDQDSRFTLWRQAARYRKDGFASATSTAESPAEPSTDTDYYGHGVRVWKSVKPLTEAEKQKFYANLQKRYIQTGYDGYAGICRKCDSKIKEFKYEAEYSVIHKRTCRCKDKGWEYYETFNRGMHGGLIEHDKNTGGRL